MPDVSPYVRVVAVISQGPQLARIDTITSDNDTAQRRTAEIIAHAAQTGRPLPNLAATQTAWIVPLPADVLHLINDLTDADDCWFDHHGGCQAHGYLSLEPGQTCPHQDAKNLIAAARKEGLMPDGT